ncbi:MAG: hypothetical protein ACLQVY_22975 [Limisphaerales bacterium]
MARFQAAEPNGVAVQQLEVVVRTAVFQSANQVVAYLLQQAADRIDAAYQPKPGWQRKGRAQLTVDCIFAAIAAIPGLQPQPKCPSFALCTKRSLRRKAGMDIVPSLSCAP